MRSFAVIVGNNGFLPVNESSKEICYNQVNTTPVVHFNKESTER